jgi:hypothetical protein
VARLTPCPSFINTTRQLGAIQIAPINSNNLILFAKALSKAINKLHQEMQLANPPLSGCGMTHVISDAPH